MIILISYLFERKQKSSNQATMMKLMGRRTAMKAAEATENFLIKWVFVSHYLFFFSYLSIFFINLIQGDSSGYKSRIY